MKNLLLAILLLSISYSSQAQWQQCNKGFSGIGVNAVLQTNSALYAGTDRGVFISNDNGSSWELPDNKLGGTSVRSLAIKGDVLFAGTASSGIYRSKDKGLTWEQVNNGIKYFSVWSMIVKEQNVYACAFNDAGGAPSVFKSDVYKTTNDGDTWEPADNGLPVNSDLALCLALSQDEIYVTFYEHGIYKSTDEGSTWNSASSGLPIGNFRTVGAKGNYVYAGTYGNGIYVSSDGGDSWEATDKSFSSNMIYSISFNGNDVYAGTYEKGVYKTTNNGKNWLPVNNGMPYYNRVPSIVSTETNILIGTKFGVYQSINSGASWTGLNNGLSRPAIMEFGVLDNDIYAVPDGSIPAAGPLYVSKNNGDEWSMVTDTGIVGSSKILFNNGNMIMMGAAYISGKVYSGVSISTDKGKSWTFKYNGLPFNKYMSDMAVSGNNIILGSSDGIYLSKNYGTDWTTITNGIADSNVQCVAMDGNKMFAGTFLGGIFCSTDMGASWTKANKSITINDVKEIILNENYIIAMTMEEKHFYYSTDKGDTWQAGNEIAGSALRAIAVRDNYIFAGTDGDGVFMSTDRGASWKDVTGDLKSKSVSSLALKGDYIFAGTSLFNNGQLRSEGIFRANINSLLTGIEDSKENTCNLSIFPNPVTSNLTIQRSVTGNATLVITNQLGQKVYQSCLNEENRTVNIDFTYPAGVYFIKLIKENGSIEQSRFVKY